MIGGRVSFFTWSFRHLDIQKIEVIYPNKKKEAYTTKILHNTNEILYQHLNIDYVQKTFIDGITNEKLLSNNMSLVIYILSVIPSAI